MLLHALVFAEGFKVMYGTIRNDDFWRNAALQHCCDIVSNGYNIVPTLLRCFALKLELSLQIVSCNIIFSD